MTTASRVAKVLPDDLKEVRLLLMEAFRRSARGDLPPGRASELSTLARAVVAIHEAGVASLERSDLAAEVAALKAAVQEQTR